MSLQFSQTPAYQFMPLPPPGEVPLRIPHSAPIIDAVISPGDSASDARRIFDAAMLHENAGNLKSAAVAYRELARIRPTPEAYLVLGGVYFKQGDHQRMLFALRRSLAAIQKARRRSLPVIPGTEVGAHYGLAVANLMLGKLQPAKLEARTALAVDPQNAGARLVLGYAHELDGEYEKAADDYEQAILLEPNLRDAYMRLVDLLVGMADRTAEESLRKGLTEAAISTLRQTIDRFPSDSSQAHNNLGVLLNRMEDHQGALREFEAAVKAAPQNIAAVTNLGLAYVAAGHLEEALRIYENAAVVISGGGAAQSSYVFNGLGMALAKASETDHGPNSDLLARAEGAFLKAIDFDPHNSDARNNLGTIYGAMGRLDDALNQFNLVLQFDPQNQYARDACSEVSIRKYSPGPPDDPKEQARIDSTLQFLERLRQEGDEEEQRETFARLKQALDEDRLSYRRLFSE
ncbi:MAG TPA: tetratricopeptide repeat protein [Blastocatellia bacterium]